LAGANNIRPTGITQIGWRVGLFYCVDGKETRNVLTLDSNLVAHRAAKWAQHCRVSRAAFRVILQRVLLGQSELQDLRIVFGRHDPVFRR
jgi:hypothetical protein